MYVLARKFRPITISKQFTSCFLGENECGKISKRTNGQHKHFYTAQFAFNPVYLTQSHNKVFVCFLLANLRYGQISV